jgi:hypothetical protein
MNLTYYQILTRSYLVAISLWWVFSKMFPEAFVAKEEYSIKRPLVQVGITLFCVVVVIIIGRIYASGYLFPDFTFGSFRVGETLNQMLIYCPFPLFLIISKQTLSSAWLPTKKFAPRFLLGIGLSMVALVVFVLLSNKKSISVVAPSVFNIQNTHHLVQVFLEDLAIALLLSRLSASLKPNYFVGAIVAVSVLFPLAHLPNNLQTGAPMWQVLTSLAMDGVLVFVIGLVLYKFRDFLWFFPVHFAMDMMQFYSGLDL